MCGFVGCIGVAVAEFSGAVLAPGPNLPVDAGGQSEVSSCTNVLVKDPAAGIVGVLYRSWGASTKGDGTVSAELTLSGIAPGIDCSISF